MDMTEVAPARVVLGRGALTGAAGGAIFGVAAGLLYAASNWDLPDVPWATLGPSFLAYSIAAGALAAGGAAGGVGALDAAMGARHWATPVPAATLGGALGLALPGAIGGAWFGAMSLPFLGGVGVFAVPVLGAIIVAIALAVQDRVHAGRGAAIGRASAMAIGAALVLGGVIGVAAWRVGDGRLLDLLRSGVTALSPADDGRAPVDDRAGLAALGTLLGLGLGATLGAYVGVVMSAARRLR